MKVFLDHIEKHYEKKFNNLDELIILLNKELEPTGRIVAIIYADGEEVLETSSINLDETMMLELISKPPRVLLNETLDEANEYITKFIENVSFIRAYIESGDNKKAIDLVLEGIHGLEWIFGVLTTAEGMVIVDARQIDFIDIFHKADCYLNHLISGLENKDYYKIVQLLEYEISGLLLNIQEKIPFLIDTVLEEDKREKLMF